MKEADRLAERKQALRAEMRAALRAMTAAQRAAGSAAIVKALQEDVSWLPPEGRVVALFGGLPSEPDLRPLLPWLASHGRRAAFFAVSGEEMVPHAVRVAGELRTGVLGVMEPDLDKCEALSLGALGVVLVPGLAFSPRTGLRLGRGRAYYDRLLSRVKPECRRIGVCFTLQFVDGVPAEPHDLPVEALVTEQGWRRIA